MTCGEARPLLSAVVDGEIDLSKSLEIEAHVEDCSACTEAFEDLRRLRQALRDPALRHSEPPSLKIRVRRALRRERGYRRSFVLPAGLAVAAALLVGVFLDLRGATQDGALASEVASAHLRSLLADRRVDVESSDRHTVKPFFNGRLDYAPPVPDLEASGYTLLGGRVDIIKQRRVAALVYRRRKHPVTLFVWPSSGERTRAPELVGGNSVTGFVSDGFTFWAVSDLSPSELRELPRLVSEALRTPPAVP